MITTNASTPALNVYIHPPGSASFKHARGRGKCEITMIIVGLCACRLGE